MRNINQQLLPPRLIIHESKFADNNTIILSANLPLHDACKNLPYTQFVITRTVIFTRRHEATLRNLHIIQELKIMCEYMIEDMERYINAKEKEENQK